MRLTGVIWLEDVVDKLLRKHAVSTEEVEQILESKKTQFRRLERGRVQDEDLFVAVGAKPGAL